MANQGASIIEAEYIRESTKSVLLILDIKQMTIEQIRNQHEK